MNIAYGKLLFLVMKELDGYDYKFIIKLLAHYTYNGT